jgi:hypothetical protein
MDTRSKYVDMMIYFLFVKGVIEVGYNVYNSGLWKVDWHNTQQDTDDTDTTYNAGLWNFNWHNTQQDTDEETIFIDDSISDDTKAHIDEIQTHIPFTTTISIFDEQNNLTEKLVEEPEPLHDVNGYNEDIIYTNKYDDTISNWKDSKYS